MKHKINFMLIVVMFIFGISTTSFAENHFEQSALALVENFLVMVSKETPWTFSEECSLLSASTSSIVLMMQADIMREDGTWTKKEPDQSLLGKLLQSRRELFSFPDSERQIFFLEEKNNIRGTVVVLYRKKKTKEFAAFDEEPVSKCIIFCIVNYAKPGKHKPRIDLDDSFIDGRNLPYLLGFRNRTKKVKILGEIVDKTVPYFPEKTGN